MESADILSLAVRGTVAASIAICVVMLVRKPARAAFGAHVAYASWLLVPAAVLASFIPRRVVLPAPVEPAASAGTSALPAAAPTVAVSNALEQLPDSGIALPDASTIVLLLWITGAVVSLALVAIDHRRLVARLRLRPDGSVYRSEQDSAGPALIGVVRPRIIVPAGFEKRYDAVERDLVLAHEREHIRAGDAQINALAAAAQCLNWFNPLFYVARRALRVDQELACDERVMRRHSNRRRAYAEAMLKTQLSAEAIPLGCHWPALGASALSDRITMLRRPSPKPLVRSAGALACAGAVMSGSVVAWAAQEPQVTYAEAPRPAPSQAEKGLGGELIDAIQDGDAARARQLISAGADVNRIRLGDGSPLILAARSGDAVTAGLLLKAGADVNRAVRGDGNPLIVAAYAGRLDLVEMFVKAGADVNAYVPSDETPLIAAARENRLDVARYLIAAGADVNFEVDAPTLDGTERRSPMIMARRGGHTEMIRLLREHGART